MSEVYKPDIPGEDDPGRGRRLSFDVGLARIGVASCDPDGILATPVETIHLRQHPWPEQTLERISELTEEYEPVEFVVGLPRTLKGRSGQSVEMALEFVEKVRETYGQIPVRLVDERLSTVVATQALRDSRVKSRSQRSIVDQAAAVEILNTWLNLRKKNLEQGEK